jgi:hypothetical protein
LPANLSEWRQILRNGDSLAERYGFELPVPLRIHRAKLSAEVARFSA